MRLIIGNKRYSSWSLRPWLVLTHFGIPFEETLIPLDRPETHAAILAVSPSGRVPCLIDGDRSIWESLAIIEYLAETVPEAAIWPRDRSARALARSLASEMHAGFVALRTACPMNLRRIYAFKPRGEAAAADVARIEAMWRDARQRFGADGPFLFGAFSAADAMFGPVVHRLNGYSWPMQPDTAAYVAAMLAEPAMRAWSAGADAEDWIEPLHEVED